MEQQPPNNPPVGSERPRLAEWDPQAAALLEQIQTLPAQVVVERYEKAVKSGMLEGQFGYALEDLPRVNLPHAREVFSTFAQSTDPDQRFSGALLMHNFTPYDRELGVRLWDQLMRDEDERVRGMAFDLFFEPLEGQAEDNLDDLDSRLTEYGITWRDAFMLIRAYEKAERGINLHRIG